MQFDLSEILFTSFLGDGCFVKHETPDLTLLLSEKLTPKFKNKSKNNLGQIWGVKSSSCSILKTFLNLLHISSKVQKKSWTELGTVPVL